jgi:hypothetical protein
MLPAFERWRGRSLLVSSPGSLLDHTVKDRFRRESDGRLEVGEGRALAPSGHCKGYLRKAKAYFGAGQWLQRSDGGRSELGNLAGFAGHLRDGEHVLWHVAQNESLAEAWYLHIRRKTLLMVGLFAAIGLYVGYRRYDVVIHRLQPPDFATGLADLLSFGFAAAALCISAASMWVYLRFAKDKSAGALRPCRYAMTNMRLLEVDYGGKLQDEMDVAAIAEVYLSTSKDSGGGLAVCGEGKPRKRKLFSISHVDDAPGIEARINELRRSAHH